MARRSAAGGRVHIVIDKQSHMLLIEDMTKEGTGHYSFTIPTLPWTVNPWARLCLQCDLHSLRSIFVSEHVFPTKICIHKSAVCGFAGVDVITPLKVLMCLRAPRLCWNVRSQSLM